MVTMRHPLLDLRLPIDGRTNDFIRWQYSTLHCAHRVETRNLS